MKKFFKEFKEFALRGSVMDLAIGVIIGAAFQAIVNSLVKDIMSPLIGLVAKTDLSDLSVEIFGVFNSGYQFHHYGICYFSAC